MYLKLLTAITLLAGITQAQIEDPDHPYIAPTSSDLRSACPGLNVLANHGYINRNGLNITAESATLAQMKAFNFSRAVSANPIPAVLKYSTTGVSDTFNIDDISRPPLDHDGKLTRGDYTFGDTITFNRTIWDSVLALLPDEMVTWKQMADAGAARLTSAKAENGAFSLPDAQLNATFEQMSGIIAAFGGSPVDGEARRDWINATVVEERLQWGLGWKTSEMVLEGGDFGPLVGALREYQPGGI